MLAGDLVVLPGCTADTDCNPQESFSCRQPVGGATGLCLPIGAAQSVVDGCTRFMGSRRRYEIVSATPTQLTLGSTWTKCPRPRSIAWPQPRLATIRNASPPTPIGLRGRTRVPVAAGVAGRKFKRCVKACGYSETSATTDAAGDPDCRPGFVCATLPGSLGPQLSGDAGPRPGPGRYCVEAPPLDLACWPQPTNRYHVNVGTSFLVLGSSLPDLKTTTEINGQCQLDPNRDPALADRIPLSAPSCVTIDGVVPIDNVTKYSTTGSPGATNTEVALFGQLTPPVPDGSDPTNKGTPATPNPPYSPVTPPGPNPCLYQDLNYDESPSVASTPGTGLLMAGPWPSNR